jgi:hypothetical protein
VSLRRRYASPAEARRIARALEADRPEFLTTEVRGATLAFRLRPASPESARATLDDLLAAVAVAERVPGVTHRPRRASGPGPRDAR